jgi:hypothetical protein
MCDERERLIGYLYDECDEGERQVVESHLQTCSTCRDEIGGFHQVREDLLGWDVPARESVWQPFAPPRPVAWWREVPGWALAAAASVTFLAGAGGGAVAYALLPPAPPAALGAERVVPRGPSVPVVFDNVTRRELTAAEQRIVDMLRAEMADRLTRARAADRPTTVRVANGPAPAAGALTDADHSEIVKIVNAIIREVVEHRKVTDDRLQDLGSQVDYLRTAVTSPGGR